jgi:hypothetical protein
MNVGHSKMEQLSAILKLAPNVPQGVVVRMNPRILFSYLLQ